MKNEMAERCSLVLYYYLEELFKLINISISIVLTECTLVTDESSF